MPPPLELSSKGEALLPAGNHGKVYYGETIHPGIYIAADLSFRLFK